MKKQTISITIVFLILTVVITGCTNSIENNSINDFSRFAEGKMRTEYKITSTYLTTINGKTEIVNYTEYKKENLMRVDTNNGIEGRVFSLENSTVYCSFEQQRWKCNKLSKTSQTYPFADYNNLSKYEKSEVTTDGTKKVSDIIANCVKWTYQLKNSIDENTYIFCFKDEMVLYSKYSSSTNSNIIEKIATSFTTQVNDEEFTLPTQQK